MEPGRLKALLEKYWSAETSEEEEQELKKHFAATGDADGNPAAPLFDYFRQQQQITPDDKFDERLQSITTSTNGKVKWLTPLLKVAAVLLIVFSIIYVILPGSKGTSVVLTEKDTYDDPNLAYQEAKKALLLISHHLNTGGSYIGEVGKLNKAEQLINTKAGK